MLVPQLCVANPNKIEYQESVTVMTLQRGSAEDHHHNVTGVEWKRTAETTKFVHLMDHTQCPPYY